MPGEKPRRYDYLTELADTCLDQISIEGAQPQLDMGVLPDLATKTIMLAVLDLSTENVESTAIVVDRIRRALPYVSPERLTPALDCGMKYLPRAAARGKLVALGAAMVQALAELGFALV